MPGNMPQIESKNLTMLEDQMNYEQLAYKKCQQYSTMFTDQALKNLSTELARHHKQHFDALFSYLNSHQ